MYSSYSNLAPAYSAQTTYAVGDLVTYSGKLYKCIVAIVTPEAFNINKWDDVTTSEVYAQKPLELLFEHDGVKTSSELYVEARAAIIAIPNYRFKKIDIYTGIGSQYGTQMHLSAIDSVDENPTLYFNAGTCSANSATMRNMLITSSAAQGCSIVLNSSGNTVTTTDYTQVATSDIKVTIV